MKLLLLGGTSEARALAKRLHPDVDLISSLAGRVPDPALPVGPVRVGGFGGAPGLRKYLVDNAITAVVDATHPFAATITANAAQACADLHLPHLVLARPAWPHGDAVIVANDREAALTVKDRGYQRIFLTTGRSGTTAFRGNDAWFLIRAVTLPEPETLPPNHEILLSRGPYDYDNELALLRTYGIDALVTKNSGGGMTRAKIDAAQAQSVPVIMVDRPALPAGVTTVSTVDDAERWVRLN
ncbi:cobalt-precorrin-6A reductase [Mycobacterium sp. CBMA293]|uniref:cobalt-precorrin-6A reductase n=1 Tax=unclassified Mycolicibacterium TaxID=2636767 RepID=UPI0012DDEA88|nr:MULTISPECIES: cobalt-precorrin-6A reductase [unclassified Mycolicibacterium]MUL45314.1 cobalt-precorrin-6A reductase [Mycolicibacterium sp. CBMA 360]MUL56834.1 cobalt-precorrin-6A reductase [Mycolicibacterium sp. CBMA 335]MUL69873.1 cobalt-precorrin-6A reductase [Mycolicibacterium sp. CBMA 311]MUL91921.1 cobalt-precorrin-6A reductase [Mycolicibacterium sp. CBMA 230]MUM05660.1 cobalt-precorrin-6A reductase [Mycolicibacterium sp. CBMA 213]